MIGVATGDMVSILWVWVHRCRRKVSLEVAVLVAIDVIIIGHHLGSSSIAEWLQVWRVQSEEYLQTLASANESG